MQNDVLKNNIVPWQEKGRWYHATLNFDADSNPILDLKNSDQLIIDNFEFLDGVCYVTPSNHNLLDMKCKLHSEPIAHFIGLSFNFFWESQNMKCGFNTLENDTETDIVAEFWFFISD